MRPNETTMLAGLSRRSLLVSWAAAASLIMLSCKSERPGPIAGRSVDDLRMGRFMDGFSAVARREPSLPGVRSLAEISARVAQRIAPADQALLSDVMYLEARDALSRSRRPVSEETIARALARPIDAERATPEYFVEKLAAARSRRDVDPGYGQALMIRANDPFFHGRCENELTGETVPCAMWVFQRTLLITHVWDTF